MKPSTPKVSKKSSNKKLDPTIVTALISGFVTIIAGLLASPVIIAWINKTPLPPALTLTASPIQPPLLTSTEQATETSAPTEALFSGPCPDAEMVLIPEGMFLMGASETDEYSGDDVRPQREIFISTFCIDKYEVSNLKYALVVKDHPSNRQTAELPVVDVTWEDASAYCEKMGKSLPTEAQWEKAARWIDQRIYPWGNTWQSEYANSGESPVNRLSPVDSFADVPTAYGILNMAGNAAEWVSDWYTLDWYTLMPAVDPIQSTEPVDHPYKIARGGSYLDTRQLLRTFVRDGTYTPDESSPYIGFRCATTNLVP